MIGFSILILLASLLHIAEEFYYPGRFLTWARTNFPRFQERMNVRSAVIINTLFLLLCISCVIWGNKYPALPLSVAGLILVNGTIHFGASIITRGYSPGLVTSVLVYIPLSIYIFVYFSLSAAEVMKMIVYGILYHAAVPLVIFFPFNKT